MSKYWRFTQFVCLVVCLTHCRTSSTNANASQASGDIQSSQASNGSGFNLVNPPSVGPLLAVGGIDVQALQFGKLAALKITVLEDSYSDFIRLVICDYAQPTACNPSVAQPFDSASGVFFIYELPAQTVSISAQGCVNPENSLTPSLNCGQPMVQLYVANSVNLNPAEASKLFADIRSEESKIQDQCQSIRDGLNTYLQAANNNQPVDPNVLNAVQNQLNLTTPQLCKDFMSSASFDTVASAASSNGGVPKAVNYAIAISLGTFSGLMILASSYGSWRLSRALFSKNLMEEFIDKASSDNAALTSFIETKKKTLAGRIKLQLLGEEARASISTELSNSKDLNQLQQLEKILKSLDSEIASRQDEIKNLNLALADLDNNRKSYEKRVALEELRNKKIEAKTSRDQKLAEMVNITNELRDLKEEVESWEGRAKNIKRLSDEITISKSANATIINEMYDVISTHMVSDPTGQKSESVGSPGNAGWKILAEKKAASPSPKPSEEAIFRELSVEEKIAVYQAAHKSLIDDYEAVLKSKDNRWFFNFWTKDSSLFSAEQQKIGEKIYDLKYHQDYGLGKLDQDFKNNSDTLNNKISSRQNLETDQAQTNMEKIQTRLAELRTQFEKSSDAGSAVEKELFNLRQECTLLKQKIVADETAGLTTSQGSAKENLAQTNSDIQDLTKRRQNLEETKKRLADLQVQIKQEHDNPQGKSAELLNESKDLIKNIQIEELPALSQTSIDSLNRAKVGYEKQANNFKIMAISTGVLAVLGAAGAAGAAGSTGLGLVTSADSTLMDTLSTAVANIRNSRQTIDGLWQQLGATAQP